MAKLALIILDGFGVASKNFANPRSIAKTPNLDNLEKGAFAVKLQASGIAVGMPWGEAGNSEVGHTSMGSGRILYHYLPRIVMAIRDGSFFKNAALVSAFEHVKKTDGRLHIMGLTSSGSVHAYVDHLYALFDMAQQLGVKLYLHAFTDGRDSEPREAAKFMPQIQERMAFMGVGRIATLCGRNFAMDREKRWDRTEKFYNLLVKGDGERIADLRRGLEDFYARGATDTDIPPSIVGQDDNIKVQSGDALIFFNFREDSARQAAEAFGFPSFDNFPRTRLKNFKFVTFSKYEEGIEADVAFPPIVVKDTFGEVVSRAGLSQLRIAETEKYAHVTYFFNGGVETAFHKEDRLLIPSVSDVSDDKNPEMRAFEIKDAILDDIEKDKHDVLIANLANFDMVGHTGNFKACAQALEAVDQALGPVISLCQKKRVMLFITADHGNIEEKRDINTGRPVTEHTVNPVPLFIMGPLVNGSTGFRPENFLTSTPVGFLADIAPTMLAVLGIDKPKVMIGRNLLG